MDFLASAAIGARKLVPTAPMHKHLERLSTSQKVALVYKDEIIKISMTYAELHSQTNALARAMTSRASGTGPNRDGDYVFAICMQPTHHTVMALLAAWKAGAAYLPMEPSLPQARINHIMNDAEPALLVYDDTVNPVIFQNNKGIPAVSFKDLLLESSEMSESVFMESEQLSPSRNDSIAVVIYTSGSTGIPKGVRLSYNAICNRLWWQFSTFPYYKNEMVCVWKTPLTFLDSFCEIWGPLINERTLLIVPRETVKNPQKFVRLLAENQVQRLVVVPTLLRSILMYLSMKPSKRPLKHLKFWVCSGETLTIELAREFFKYFGDNGYQLANFYGSTEVMADVTYYVINNAAQVETYKAIPIGSPIQNCAVYLLDKEMNQIEEGSTGELWVSGLNLASGYVGGHTAEKFITNPYRYHPDLCRLYSTGDFGILQKGLVVLYAGRDDSQVKIRGQKVDLQEVEKAVSSIAGIDQCVVLYHGENGCDPAILAFVTLCGAQLSSRQIEVSLKEMLTYYMIPQVIIIEDIPIMLNGKVDRQGLLNMYESRNNNGIAETLIDIDYTGVQQKDMKKAEVLFTTIAKVLSKSARVSLSPSADFFELGGNSLNSIYTITRLRDRGYHINISDFLGASNLGELLGKLSTKPSCEESAETKFTVEPLQNEHKLLVIDMIISSFCCDCCEGKDYAQYISASWNKLLEAQLSVVLTDASGTPVAVALNFDAHDEADFKWSSGLAKTMRFLECVESSFKDTMLPQGKGAILHSSMMATALTLGSRDNVTAIYMLERATMLIGKEKRFKGIFATNTSPLTQQLGTDVLGFQTLLNYQINQYVDSNGTKVFADAPDDKRAVVCWKSLE